MALDGHLTTITFGTSVFVAEWNNVEGSGNDERADIETSHLGTADNYKTYIPASLVDGGEFSADINWTGAEDPPTTAVVETITIDWAGTALTWAFSGYIKSASPSAASGERMQASIVIKVAGPITKVVS